MREYEGNRIVHEEVVRTPEETKKEEVEHATRVQPSQREAALARLRRISRVVYFFVHVVSIFIVIRFILVAAGADPSTIFAQFLYGITYPFIFAFRGLFGPLPAPQFGVQIYEFANFVAIFIYYLFAWIGTRLARFFILRPRGAQS